MIRPPDFPDGHHISERILKIPITIEHVSKFGDDLLRDLDDWGGGAEK